MDGHLKDEDVNLASSTLVAEGKSTADAMGIVISYSVRVKVNCGTLGGELVTDVPFKLMTPAPGNFRSNYGKLFTNHEYNSMHYTDLNLNQIITFSL